VGIRRKKGERGGVRGREEKGGEERERRRGEGSLFVLLILAMAMKMGKMKT